MINNQNYRERGWRRVAMMGVAMFFLGSLATVMADPPERVGRLNYLSGSVSFRPASVEDWEAAPINYPLTTGDHIWTDDNSRAEMHIGSTVVRLDQNTALNFLNIDDNIVQLRLSQGTLTVNLRNLRDDDAFEIDTPNSAVSLLRPGLYRIDVNGTGDATTVIVTEGQSEVTGAGQAFNVRPHQTAYVTGVESPTYDVENSRDRDSWDEWCVARDRSEEQSESLRYVSRDVVGYEDLDSNGTWRNDSEYGAVWVPTRVAVGWAPYRYGHWAWVEPWGWTWIDDARWGFAPFHYGRWAYINGYWGWCPGRLVARPVYAPALVAFVGGGRWSLSLGFGGGGGVAWFPLGPREVFVPSYRVSNTYIRNVNVTHVNVTNINITNINRTNVTYVNQTAPGAVTAVSRTDFASSRRIGNVAVKVPANAVASAQVVTTAQVAPQRASIVASSTVAGRTVARPPATVVDRAVVARTTPPPPPVPFAQKQQMLQQNPGQPLDSQTISNMRRQGPAVNPVVKMAPATTNVNSNRPAVNNRDGQPNRPATPNSTNRPANANTPNNARPSNTTNSDRPVNNRPAATDKPANTTNSDRPANNRPANTDRPANTTNTDRTTNNNRPANDRPTNTPANRPANDQPNNSNSNGSDKPATHTPPPESNRPVNRGETNSRPTPPPPARTEPKPNQETKTPPPPAKHEEKAPPKQAEKKAEDKKPEEKKPSEHFR